MVVRVLVAGARDGDRHHPRCHPLPRLKRRLHHGALAVANSVVQVVGRPQVEWMGVLQETYKGMVNLATLGAIMAYVQDQVSTAWFSHLFQWLAIVSIIPAAIASLLGPIISFIQGVKICLFTCSGLFTGLGSAGGAAAMVTAVVRGDDGMQDRALYALESDDDDKPADKHQQLAPPQQIGRAHV